MVRLTLSGVAVWYWVRWVVGFARYVYVNYLEFGRKIVTIVRENFFVQY